MRLAINAFTTGALLGLMQWAAFLQIQAFVSATAGLHALCLACWLGGGLAGFAAARRGPEIGWLAAAVGAYYLLAFGVSLAGRSHSVLAAIFPLTAVMGAYAGCFFLRRSANPAIATGRLLGLEGAGTAAGIALAAAGAAAWGRSFLLVGPGLLGLSCLATLPRATAQPQPLDPMNCP
jgi:hypothetical protein